MALPTLEQYRASSATWKREHRGITYTLSHHGASDHTPQGTWCFYIHLLEDQFQRPEDFGKFNREPTVKQMIGGGYWKTYDYSDVPDYGFHGGITWYSRERYVNKETGDPRWALKIGCDYAHLWDEEGGRWQGLEDVARDAVSLIDNLLREVPMKLRCGYSGVFDMPEEFYTARNGATVHKSQLGEFSDDKWPMWLPDDAERPGEGGADDGKVHLREAR